MEPGISGRGNPLPHLVKATEKEGEVRETGTRIGFCIQ